MESRKRQPENCSRQHNGPTARAAAACRLRLNTLPLPFSVILGLAVAAALITSVAVFKRYLPYTGVPLSPAESPPIMLVMEDTHLVGLGHGTRLWSVSAGKIEIARNRSSATVTEITDGKIYDQGKVALKVRAGKAAYDIYGRNLLLSNGIHIEGTDGQRLSAEGAVWNSLNSTLRSSGRINFEWKWSRLQADSLVMDLRTKRLDMWNVRMHLKVPSEW